jgi:DNA-binding MarR family transcriptional regulator
MSAPVPDREPVDPSRVRALPLHFAWADHRLRDILYRLSLEEIALLFFLHLAADRNGCSFWADSTIAKRLGIHEGDVVRARDGLLRKGFVAYRFPLHQVLPFEAHER